MTPLETYLQEMRTIRSSGAVPETAYYPALEALLSETGKKLKPKVKCIIHPGNRGAGLPDGGLFTDDQLRVGGDDPLRGIIPARGVIEAKGIGDKAEKTAASSQVAQYWERYRQVLVTNYRDFLLVGSHAEGTRAVLETFHLAGSEDDFWRAAAHPRKTADLLGEGFEEFLKRVMLYQAPLAAPKDLAWFLASYAREARMRVGQSELDALESIRTALEEALGLRFDGKGGHHFFQSTLIQTLFYGIFSAWVLWDKTHARTSRTARFDWRLAAQYLKVPILRKLFYEVAEPGQLEALGLPEVLDWACAALNRVDRGAFWRTFKQDKAVQYFYEPFLEAFDPELRKDLGVWYTPTEVVQYMVGRIDQILRQDLNRPDGLADPSVYVLDPCCGTGAFLVEVLQKIAATLRAKGGDALLANDLKRAAVDRVFGFEILPAPFVVAHLQIGLLLQGLGAPLSGTRQERVQASALRRVGGGARRSRRGEARAAHPCHPRQSTLQQLCRHRLDGGGARFERRLPEHVAGRARSTGAGLERSLRALLPHGRAAHRREDRPGYRVLHLELLVAGRPVVHWDARTVSGGLRPDLDRQPSW
jgi:SAM-dependent methyltransferase